MNLVLKSITTMDMSF